MSNLFSPMSPATYGKILARLDLTSTGIGAMLGISPRTSRMYASGELEIPLKIALPLRLIEDFVPYKDLDRFRTRPPGRPLGSKDRDERPRSARSAAVR